MSAEIQTISAVFDLLKLAWSACVFLKKVKDADKIASEVHERVNRLTQVLEGVWAVLQKRENAGVPPASSGGQSVENRISESIKACHTFLQHLQQRVGGFEPHAASTDTLVARFKIAFRQTSIIKRQTDLEARISVLQTDLVVLQLFDQASIHVQIGSNQSELVKVLSKLNQQVQNGHALLKTLVYEQRKLSTASNAEDVPPPDAEEAAAVQSLNDCLRNAEDIHERYTSEYLPDDRSLRFQDQVLAERQTHSQPAVATPASERASVSRADSDHSSTHQTGLDLSDRDTEDDEDVWPLEVLNGHIEAYQQRATKELESEHFNQAESNLNHAIRNAELREQRYGVPFTDRLRMEEDIAFLYQKQNKWGEAVAKMHQLLRDDRVTSSAKGVSDIEVELIRARQNQLLAQIYFDRHQHSNGPALSHSAADAENAERHAKRAFNKRFALLKLSRLPAGETEKHDSCIQLLVRILEARDKTVEANEIGKMISDGSSTASDSIGRTSTAASRQAPDYDVVDKHDILIDAIKAGDTAQIQAILASRDIDVERLCRENKTPLMHAVERSDESTVHKLLDPNVGADVNRANKRGITALHLAAASGHHEMVHCLVHHDADIDAKDRRGDTPVMKAVKAEHSSVVQILFDSGANMLVKDIDEWSLLHHAVHRDKTDMTAFLLDLESRLKEAVDQAGKVALHHCAELEYQDQTKVLLEHKHHLDVNATDSSSRTPLYFAASKPSTPKREDMVQLLLKHGAQLDLSRLPPRYRDYSSLKPYLPPKRENVPTRHDSISTEGTVGSTSTGMTRLSRVFSSRMGIR